MVDLLEVVPLWGWISLRVELLEGDSLWWWIFSLRVYLFGDGFSPWGWISSLRAELLDGGSLSLHVCACRFAFVLACVGRFAVLWPLMFGGGPPWGWISLVMDIGAKWESPPQTERKIGLSLCKMGLILEPYVPHNAQVVGRGMSKV